MIDLKPYGAFIENTIRPLFEEFRELLDIAEENGLSITEDNLCFFLEKVGRLYIFNTIIEAIKMIAITGMVCFTAWMIALWTT